MPARAAAVVAGQLGGQLPGGQPLGVAQHRHQQAPVGLRGDAQVHPGGLDDPLALGVDAGVELRDTAAAR